MKSVLEKAGGENSKDYLNQQKALDQVNSNRLKKATFERKPSNVLSEEEIEDEYDALLKKNS